MKILDLVVKDNLLGIDMEDRRDWKLGDERFNKKHWKFNFKLSLIIDISVRNELARRNREGVENGFALQYYKDMVLEEQEKKAITKHALIANFEFQIDLRDEHLFLDHLVDKIAKHNFIYYLDFYKESKFFLSEILESRLKEKAETKSRKLKI